MPISISHKYAFVHVPKTGGASMHAALATVTKVERLPKNLRIVHHATADNLKEEVKARTGHGWEDYYSFAFVRNPWDRVVSTTFYLGLQFEDVMAGKIPHWMFRSQIDYVHDSDGKQAVTFLGRYENLQADWDRVQTDIGIRADLPHLNQSKDAGYRRYYTPETRDIVAEWYRDDIETFGYEF